MLYPILQLDRSKNDYQQKGLRRFQHILPKGFRRVRDYGALHPNAKKLLSLVQLILNVIIKIMSLRPRPVFICQKCQSPMTIIMFRRPNVSG